MKKIGFIYSLALIAAAALSFSCSNGIDAAPESPDSGSAHTDMSVSADTASVTYTVQFNANCDTYTGTMNNMTFTCGTAQNLKANAFKRSGYSFAGWYDLANKTYYADSASVSDLTTESGGTVILYALWTINTPAITVTLPTFTDITLTYAVSGTTVTFSASAGYASYKWKLNNTTVSGETASTYTVDTSTLGTGTFEIAVIAADAAGSYYSASYTLNVK